MSKRKSIICGIIGFIIVFACFHGTARNLSEKSDRFANAEALIEKAVESSLVPSITVAVSKSGKIVWEKSAGFAHIAQGIKSTPETSYSLASISKPIAATGLMVLVEKGLIDLEKPVNDYLGDVKLHSYTEDPQKATVLRLLNHTAGLVTHWNFFYEDSEYPRPLMDETIRRYGILFVPPGTKHIYSNLGYGIAEYIIERVSGKPYAEFMRDEVFQPLGMFNSAVYLKPGEDGQVAQRYQGRGKQIPFYDFDHRGASAVYCSAHDLLRFGMFHLKNRLSDQKQIISDKTIDAMKTLRDPEVNNNSYHIGWSESKLGTYQAFSHGGSMPGVRTNLLLLPEEDIALVMFCNAGFGGLRAIGKSILEELIPGLKQMLASEKQPEPDSRPAPAEIPSQLMGRWTGEIVTYEGKFPVELIFAEKKKISFRLTGNKFADQKLKRATGRFILEKENINLTFNTQIPTSDASRQRHQTNLHLQLEDGRLTGAASAYAMNIRFGLPYFITLTKDKSE
ncbi:serine hydrolase domain-containing protein [Acidobacteriota bacterium]